MALKWLLLFAKLTFAFELTHNDNGWKPVPVDVALLRSHSVARSFIDRTYQPLGSNDGDAKVVSSQLYENIPCHRSSIKNIESPLINDFTSDVDKRDKLVSGIKEIIDSRKAKQLVIKEKLENNKKETRKNQYEVTEKPESLDQMAADEQNTYIYEVPKMQLIIPEQNTPQTLTKKFLEILAKNNLNSKTDEVNYAVSRLRNIKNRNIFVTLPSGYYVQNHISADAILAMMLSNYGFYVPGSSGYSGKHFYRHLTSNYVNNEKSTASYKIYSDTDSSF